MTEETVTTEKEAAYNSFVNNMRIMNQVVMEMKEIPILPSEKAKPGDTSYLDRVEFPTEGGMLTYMGGHSFPYRGFPYFEFVDKIDILKKISRSAISGLYHSLKKRNKLTLLTLFPMTWFFGDFIRSEIYAYYRIIDRFKVKPIRYSQCIRELHRSFSEVRTEEFDDQLRDLVCMFLEFDNAYRFRFQDVVYELNKSNLEKKPIREIKRLMSLMVEREKTQEVKDTWKLLGFVISYLIFDRKLLRLVKNVLLNLNPELVKLTQEDEHFCEKRQDYEFKFLKNGNTIHSTQ